MTIAAWCCLRVDRPPTGQDGVVVIFVDDAHLDTRGTPRLRHLLQAISSELIHDGDLFGVATTGNIGHR